MSTTEPQIIITRSENKISTISAILPIRTEPGLDGLLRVELPLLEAETNAIDESNIDKAVEGMLLGFCWACENLGKGIEKELEEMGWIKIKSQPGESILTFDMNAHNIDFRRIFGTSGDHVTKKLQVT